VLCCRVSIINSDGKLPGVSLPSLHACSAGLCEPCVPCTRQGGTSKYTYTLTEISCIITLHEIIISPSYARDPFGALEGFGLAEARADILNVECALLCTS
jgi:hypothetical protein